jgi:hypothetical protein
MPTAILLRPSVAQPRLLVVWLPVFQLEQLICGCLALKLNGTLIIDHTDRDRTQ